MTSSGLAGSSENQEPRIATLIPNIQHVVLEKRSLICLQKPIPVFVGVLWLYGSQCKARIREMLSNRLSTHRMY